MTANGTILLLDVDNTLYARSCGIVERIDTLIDRYLIERMRVPSGDVRDLRRALRAAHGTTLRGLMLDHGIDPDDYLAFVHAIDVAGILAFDEALQAMLRRIPLPKVAVTNGSSAHAHAVLDCLGIRDQLTRVYALEQLGYVPKPFPAAFQAVLDDLPARADACVLVEDSVPNVEAASRLGMRTVHVAEDVPPAPAANAVIPSILQLEDALARLGVA
jgi:putative hydrolase of the HAD superfamily